MLTTEVDDDYLHSCINVYLLVLFINCQVTWYFWQFIYKTNTRYGWLEESLCVIYSLATYVVFLVFVVTQAWTYKASNHKSNYSTEYYHLEHGCQNGRPSLYVTNYIIAIIYLILLFKWRSSVIHLIDFFWFFLPLLIVTWHLFCTFFLSLFPASAFYSSFPVRVNTQNWPLVS